MTRQLREVDVKRLNRQWRRATTARIDLLLDGVQGPYNLGGILRTGAALGVEVVWLAGSSVDPAHPSVRKVSMGTERSLRWETGITAAEAVAAVKEDGLRVVGIELADGAVPLHEAPLDGDVCLVLGNEDKGLSPATLALCDAVAYLPQPGKVGSLNVAVAAAIALAEARRREWATVD
jgi:tRNA (guanosine-2'-O-)-methyltransferase